MNLMPAVGLDKKWYDVVTRSDNSWQLIVWCIDYTSIGNFFYRMKYDQTTVWYFDTKNDALMFALKWSAT